MCIWYIHTLAFSSMNFVVSLSNRTCRAFNLKKITINFTGRSMDTKNLGIIQLYTSTKRSKSVLFLVTLKTKHMNFKNEILHPSTFSIPLCTYIRM